MLSKKLKNEIIKRLKPLEPKKIILFGSYAWSNPNEDSDIDLYIVTKDDFIPQSWKEKNKIYLRFAKNLFEIEKTVPIDIIVHTLPMHKKFLELGSSFCREVMNNGIPLNE